MRKLFIALSGATAGAVLLAAALFQGCETLDERDYAGIRVEPTYTSLGNGQSVVLTANGGWSYRWELAGEKDPYEYGSLSATYGESVTYTARKVPEAESDDYLQVVRVTGRVSNYATMEGATNEGLYAAEARINHRARK